MEKAYNCINKRGLKIISEIRFKFIESKKSPLKLLPKSKELVNLIDKYGAIIEVNRPPKQFLPRGYKNSQSLVSFYYGAPNNNFPIIWGEKNWYPLYPRYSKLKMEKAKDLKKNLSYFLNTFFHENLKIEGGAELISDDKDKRKVNNILRLKNNYFLLSLLYLKHQYKSDPNMCNQFICNFFGVTKEELRIIYVEGRRKGYIRKNSFDISVEGEELIKDLKHKRKKSSIRKITKPNLAIKNYLFLPKTFGGSS
uniref:phosphoribosyltransferase-like protein n=1 Tax=Brumimicrobium mesophilum TaxID=392717 RepID=UPI00131DA01C|nr:hypothetical protein [Brumimicrobium mesophilum]